MLEDLQDSDTTASGDYQNQTKDRIIEAQRNVINEQRKVINIMDKWLTNDTIILCILTSIIIFITFTCLL